jgi:probable F420-dependent oxidoreductase
VEFGVTLRNMGPQSVPGILLPCARAAECAGLESLWITDHLAIPPDDAEGSGGRYTDPLTTLAYLAGCTGRIRLGTGVLVLPYRRPLPMAKAVATVQELSGGRLLLGVGVGWMAAEFRAVGADRARRGSDTDEALDLLHRCFAADVVEANGQPFLFKPRPERPPIYVGGAGEPALRRAVRFGDGWLPMGADPDKLRPAAERLAELAREAGRATPAIVALGGLPLDDPPQAREQLAALAALGVSRFVQAVRYDTLAEYMHTLERLALIRS